MKKRIFSRINEKGRPRRGDYQLQWLHLFRYFPHRQFTHLDEKVTVHKTKKKTLNNPHPACEKVD